MLLGGFALAGAAGAGAYFMPLLTGALTQTGDRAALTSPPPQAPVAVPSAPFTVLLLGSDDDSKFKGEQLNTQSMILVRVIPATHRVTMLSIPRDLYVPFSYGGEGKISIAYSHDGAKSAIATVEKNFGVHVDEYVWIGLRGLVHLIDRLGGIDVPVAQPVLDDFYPDDLGDGSPYGYGRIAVLPGPQHLDGTTALEYVRSRHGDLREDFGRSMRQQQLLIAIRQRAGRVTLADLPVLAGALSNEVRTSYTVDRGQPLLRLAATIGAGDIQPVLLLPPYTAGTTLADGEDVLLPNWSLILPLVRASFP